MKTTLIALCLMCCAAAWAQDTKPTEPAAPKDEPKPEAEPKTEDLPTELGLQADFAPFIRRNYPGLDPTGEHDIFQLKNPTDPAKRHEYTLAMMKLIVFYIRELRLGPTLAKVFDQYARGKEATQPVFKVLYSQVVTQVPGGNADNLAMGRKLLLEAAKAENYAYPWYLLGEIELAFAAEKGQTALTEAFKYVDTALRIKPDFPAAVALKADLLGFDTQPRREQQLALLKPLLDKPPTAIEDLEAIAQAYMRAAGPEAGLEAMKKLSARTDLPKASTRRVKQLVAREMVSKQNLNFDEALKWMLDAVKDMSAESEAGAYIAGCRFIADCWGVKASQLVRQDRSVEPGNRDKFDEFFKEANTWYRKAVDLESKHMPLDLRGQQASLYMTFLLGSEKYEEALVWVQKYLKETPMPAHFRAILELRMESLKTALDPKEEHLLDRFNTLAKNDQLNELELALKGAQASLAARREGFSSERALRFFIEQLKSRNRRIVEYCAEFLSDTVERRKFAEAAEAGKALADRLIEESECVNDEQADLQQRLSQSLREVKHWESLARATRHVKKFVDAEKGNTISRSLSRVTAVFSSSAMVALVPGSPAELGRMEAKSVATLGPWLEKLAAAMDKQVNPEPPAEKPADEPKTPSGE